jgi:acyl carrier protein
LVTLQKKFNNYVDELVIMENKIKALFADILQISSDQINDRSTPDTIEAWDSLNHLNLIATFEEEFSIDIDPEEIPPMMVSYLQFKTYILNKLG